jgi:hypothetical protein
MSNNRSCKGWLPGALLCAAAIGGCQNAGEDHILGLNATGVVTGVVYFDRNGSREHEISLDMPVRGIGLRLIVQGGAEETGKATSDLSGFFSIARIPLGTYVLEVDPETVADSMQVVRIDTSMVFLGARDSVEVAVAISFPIVTVAHAREAVAGDKVFIEGTALNSSDAFEDRALHVASASGTMRTTRASGPQLEVGDSVRIRGTVASQNGYPILNDVTTYLLGIGTPPTAQVVTTDQAATAVGGTLDAMLVRIVSVAIVDTATVLETGDFRAAVDDGSGPVNVYFDRDIPFDLRQFAPDTVVTATGLLIPTAGGYWIVKPRSAADVLRR